ncbi:hypothetical protein VAS14_05853 [Photobacterium angustum S14]|uniref:Uncharacterized protein n=1 Tax=Photobacterium angustum (strain S14 / CCUG 15956) TaxID=314292 RepID=Q1ZRV7_PHOAS|nr:hypothetical protein VAS14_05853 [Photobacterium angustum S14]
MISQEFVVALLNEFSLLKNILVMIADQEFLFIKIEMYLSILEME